MRTLPILTVAAVAALLLAGCSGTTTQTTSHDDHTATVGTTSAPTSAVGNTGSGATSAPSSSVPQATNPYKPPTATTAVAGSGASFPKPLIENWAIQYSNLEPSVQVSYPGGGSGKGVTDITAKNVVFAGSDAPLRTDQKAAASTVLQFPDTLGAVAVMHNIDGIDAPLKLDGETIAKVFLGDISKWNDPAIAALNPGVTLPGTSIATVGRADNSGTTFVFNDFLTKTSSAWKARFGETPTNTPIVTIPNKANGNDGVSNLVKTTPNSIGYVEYGFLKSLKAGGAHVDGALVKSKDGEFLPPNSDGASKAAAASLATSPLPTPDGDWSKVSITNAAGAGSYPISSFSYMMVHNSLGAYGGKATANQLNAFRAWAWWSLHDGQAFAEPLGYSKLPPQAVKVGEEALAMVQVQ